MLGAESETELDEWVTALKRALECEDRQLIGGDKVKEKGSIDFVTPVLIYGVIYHVFELPHSTVVRAVDWQSRGCQFESNSLLYKCYWRGRY